jgi:hypothetical protein
MNNLTIRILLFIPVFVVVTTTPWWFSVLVLAGLTLYLPFYPEVIFFGYLFDTLYSVDLSFVYVGMTSATVFLTLTVFIKKQIRF